MVERVGGVSERGPRPAVPEPIDGELRLRLRACPRGMPKCSASMESDERHGVGYEPWLVLSRADVSKESAGAGGSVKRGLVGDPGRLSLYDWFPGRVEQVPTHALGVDVECVANIVE